MEEISKQYEQESVRKYCISREIIRPKANVLTAIRYLLILELLIIGLSYGMNYLLVLFGISTTYPKLYFISSILVVLVSLKRSLILSIQIYQHYASEPTRRKCTLKPSCSDYSILALKKYGVILGSYKSYIRLFKKCKGNVYEIDYP
jgi:putative component of membrane protein insertase Oxa1/YidC/SpoIIIJ protein YidD